MFTMAHAAGAKLTAGMFVAFGRREYRREWQNVKWHERLSDILLPRPAPNRMFASSMLN
jgi:hypothetical protein